MLIKLKNQIIQTDHISEAQYRQFDSADSKLLGLKPSGAVGTMLYLFMVGGQEIKLKNEDADNVWTLLSDLSTKNYIV